MDKIYKNSLFSLAEIKIQYNSGIKTADRIKITQPEDAFKLFWDLWDKDSIEHIEEVKLMLLNRTNFVLGYVNLSKGGVAGSVIDIKVLLQYAIKSNAHGLIMAHNHPSGNPFPSESDKMITRKVKEALNLVDIQLLDHLIITPDKSFKSIIYGN